MDDFDLGDIMLEATAEVQEIVREVLDELQAPHQKQQMIRMWMQMSDEQKELFAQEQPDDYRTLMDALNERSS